MKKIISVLLAIVLVFSLVSVIAFAQGEETYRDGNVEFIVIENEAYITKVLSVDDGLVVIPPVVSMDPANKITAKSAKIAAKDISGDDNETDDPYDDSFIHVVAILDGALTGIEAQVKNVTIPVYVKEIGDDALRLINLEGVTVHEKNTTFSSLNGSLYNKDQTTFLLHPQASADSSIATTVTSFAPKAFKDSALITSVTIPAGVTEIPDNCFEDCTSLASANLDGLRKIGEWAFSGTSLTSAQFGDSISEIGAFAFYDPELSLLASVVIPETAANVTVGSAAFFGCPIHSITLYRNVTEIGDHAFGFYYDNMSLTNYPLVITGYKYSPDKTTTTNTYAYATAPNYEFEFHPLDPIYTINVTATDASISEQNAQMFLYKNKNLKYTADSADGKFTFKDVKVDTYSIYVLTQYGVLVNLNKKATVTQGYQEDFDYTTDKYSPTGDLNRDGIIDMSDVSMLLGEGNYLSANPACDINHDGVVDVTDISIILDSDNYAAVADNIVSDHSTPTIPIP